MKQSIKMTKKASTDQQEIVLPQTKQNTIALDQQVSSTYIIYLYGEVGQAEDYLEEMEVLRTANEQDIVVFRINNAGGDFDTAIGFVNAIRACEATTLASIEGMCASAASMIALACDEIEVARYVAFMIHCPSGGFIGKFNDVHVQSHFYDAFVKDFYYDIYGGFLQEDEIEDVLRGTSLWYDSQGTIERLQDMAEHKQAIGIDEAKEEREAMRQALTQALEELDDEDSVLMEDDIL